MKQYGAEVLALIASDQPDQTEPGEPALSIAESSPSPAQTTTPQETIIAVVTDLDGLLTIEGLAQLLTAAPGDIVSYSDHPRFAACHGILTVETMQQEIRQAIETGQVALSPHRRLTLV